MAEQQQRKPDFIHGKKYKLVGMNSDTVYTCYNGRLYDDQGVGMNPEGLKRSSFRVVYED